MRHTKCTNRGVRATTKQQFHNYVANIFHLEGLINHFEIALQLINFNYFISA